MRFPFNRRPAPEPHPDDWVTRVFARFMAEDEATSLECHPRVPRAISNRKTAVEDVAESIGARLREERRRLRLSQMKLAAMAGAGLQSQGRYEADKRSPDAAYLAAVAAAGVDILYVVTGRREGGAK